MFQSLPAANSTFAISGVSCFTDSLVVAESFVLRINIIGKNPAHGKSANRYEHESYTKNINFLYNHIILNKYS